MSLKTNFFSRELKIAMAISPENKKKVTVSKRQNLFNQGKQGDPMCVCVRVHARASVIYL